MNTLDRRLAVVALAALALYVLACSPAFSPDGRRILVAASQTNGVCHVLMFDRKQCQWSLVASRSDLEADDDVPLASAGWTPDGRHAVIRWAVDNRLQPMVVPIGGTGPTRLFKGEELEDGVGALALPAPVLRGRLLLGAKTLRAVDLKTGEVTERCWPTPPGASNAVEGLVMAQAGGAFCIYGEDNDLSVGRVDPVSLEITPLLKAVGNQGDACYFAYAPGTRRCAVATQENQQPGIRLYRDQNVERLIPLGPSSGRIALGNMAWSPDERRLYVAVFEEAPEAADPSLFTVREFDVDGTLRRRIPLFPVDRDRSSSLVYQFALAPDGKTLAAFGGVLLDPAKARPEDWALFLVDLRRESPRVTKHMLPALDTL